MYYSTITMLLREKTGSLIFTPGNWASKVFEVCKSWNKSLTLNLCSLFSFNVGAMKSFYNNLYRWQADPGYEDSNPEWGGAETEISDDKALNDTGKE